MRDSRPCSNACGSLPRRLPDARGRPCVAPGAARTPAAPLDGAIAAACPVLHKPAAGERSGSPWARSDRSRSVARSGYRALILCLHAQGEDAEALRVYDVVGACWRPHSAPDRQPPPGPSAASSPLLLATFRLAVRWMRSRSGTPGCRNVCPESFGRSARHASATVTVAWPGGARVEG